MWDEAVTLGLFETNWLRPHPALRECADNRADGRRYRQRTPAMGLTNHILELGRILDLETPPLL